MATQWLPITISWRGRSNSWLISPPVSWMISLHCISVGISVISFRHNTCTLLDSPRSHLPLKGTLSTRDFTSILKIIEFFFLLYSAAQRHRRWARRRHLAMSMHLNGERECADWMKKKKKKDPAEILIKRYMSLGPGSLSIACRLHYSCSLCLIPPLWRAVGFLQSCIR